MNRRTSRLAAAGASVLAIVALSAVPASAHIEPSPLAIENGTTATITFDVEHGCGDSDSVKFEIKVPDGVGNPVPKPPKGWKASVEDEVVTYTGGPQDHHEALELGLQVTALSNPGPLAFPIIQTCEEGSIDWIEKTVEGQPEPEHPAPVVTITGSAPTKAQLTPPAEDDQEEEADAPTTTARSNTTTTTAPAKPSSGDDDADDSNAGPLAAGAIIAVLLIGGGAYVISRRNKDD